MADRVWRLNEEALPNEWGAPYGLRELKGRREPYGIAELLDKRSTELAGKLEALSGDHHLKYSLFDHARKFRKIGGSETIAVVVTAPYLARALDVFGSPGAANARIHEIPHGLGLGVRVGHPADTIYLSNLDDVSIPWNRRGFAS